MNDDHIQTLREMGFSQEDATSALKAADNDLQKAISVLFGEVEEGPQQNQGTGTQQSPYVVPPGPDEYPSVSVSNPQDIPEFLGQYLSHESMDHVQHYSYDTHSTDSVMLGRSVALDASSLDESLLQQYPENVRSDANQIPTILCRSVAHQCWLPLLSVLAYYAPFAKTVLETTEPTPVIAQLQRIVYFFHNFHNSRRWYIDADAFVAALGPDAPTGSVADDEELTVNMLEFLMKQQPAFRPMLESLVESKDEGITKELTVLEIELEIRQSTLYETLNELFWQKDFAMLGKITYAKVAPVAMYQILPDDNAYYTPFRLQETLYPEIYSDVALSAIQSELDVIKSAQKDYQALTRKLMDLNFFEGKKIDGLLAQTRSALAGNGAACQSIALLQQQLQQLRTEEIARQAEIKTAAAPGRVRLYENVISQLPMRRYVLAGAITEKLIYAQLTAWIDMSLGERVEFDEVRDAVENAVGTSTVLLVYADAQTVGSLRLEIEADREISPASNTGQSAMRAQDEDSASVPAENEILEESPKTTDKDMELAKGSGEAKASEAESKEPTEDIENLDAHGGEVVKRPRWEDAGASMREPPFTECSMLARVGAAIATEFLQEETACSSVNEL